LDIVNAKEMEEMEKLENLEKPEANEHFFEKYSPQIRAIVTKILCNAGQARDIDDCVSAVYLEVLEKLPQYNEIRGSMAAFVTVIARSVALNHCRDNKKKFCELVGDDKIDFLGQPLRFEDEVEFDMLVESIFEKLNREERNLFTKRFILFCQPEEIAKTLNITRHAVDMRINRLKNKIKNILKKGGIDI